MSRSAVDELLLLGLLNVQRMHGYELHDFIEHRLDLISDLTKPTAYRILDALYREGLVDRKLEREGRRPERQVYELTAAGRARFGELLREELGRADRAVYSGDVALLFADQLIPIERLALLGERRRDVAIRLAEMTRIRELHPTNTGARLAIDHDCFHLEAEIRWLDSIIASDRSRERDLTNTDIPSVPSAG
jgi:DNA-binding PadR family transcriptional regulator